MASEASSAVVARTLRVRRVILVLAMLLTMVAMTFEWLSIDGVILFTIGPGPGQSMIADWIWKHFAIWPRWTPRVAFIGTILFGGISVWWEKSISGSILRSAGAGILPAVVVGAMTLIEHRRFGSKGYVGLFGAWVMFCFALAAVVNIHAEPLNRSRSP